MKGRRMSSKKIGIYTLTGQRDKLVDYSIANKLRDFGHEVNVRSYINGALEAVCYEKPDVIIHPMPGGEYKMEFIKQCKKWGIEVIVRRGEAGIGKEQWDGLSDSRKTIMLGNWDYSPYIDLELTWGQEFTDVLAEHGHIPLDKMKVCGAFAFDVYVNNLVEPKIDDRRKTILFATGFAGADSREDYTECGLEEGHPYQNELFRLHTSARKKWIEAIKELIRDFSDTFDFEIKVRPGEVTRRYVEAFKDNSNVKVHPQLIQSFDVLNKIDILVHSGSTMAIEAHLLNIPSFNFCNVNPDPLLSKASPMFESYQELEFWLCRATPGRSNINTEVLGQLQQHLYGKMDGKACERATGFIHEHIKDKRITTNIPDVWPKTTAYHFDKENVHLERAKGDNRWICACCRRVYWTTPMDKCKCPYCGMTTQKVADVIPRQEIMEPLLN